MIENSNKKKKQVTKAAQMAGYNAARYNFPPEHVQIQGRLISWSNFSAASQGRFLVQRGGLIFGDGGWLRGAAALPR